jgi:hypothetical protein
MSWFDWANRRLSAFTASNRAAVDSVNTLIFVGATLFIGIFVLSQIGESMPQDGSGNVDLPLFNDAFDQAQNVLASAFELGAILPIVVVAAGLLFYVRRFNNAGGRR